MKRKRPFFFTYVMILIFITNLPTLLSAQITITNNDMPSVSDTIRLSNGVSVPGIDYTETGENFNWDFSELLPLVQSVDTFVSVTSVPFLYQLIFLPNIVANLAQPFTEIDFIPGAPISEAYRFYRKSSASYNDVGFAFTVNDIPVPLRFDDPDIIYKFPLNYGNADSSFSGIEFGLPDLGFISIDRKRVNNADGWGTLTTTYGTFDVLRLKSRVIETDSIYIDSLGFGTALERDYIEYKWLANGFKAPLLQITEEGPLVTVAWIDSIFDPTVNISELSAQNQIRLFPNPFKEATNLTINRTTAGDLSINIYDLAGKKIHTVFSGYLPSGNHKLAIRSREANLKKGFYLLSIESKNEIKTKKLIIQ